MVTLGPGVSNSLTLSHCIFPTWKMGINIPIWGPMRYVVLGPKWGSLPSSSELRVSGTHRPLGILLAKISGVLEVK